MLQNHLKKEGYQVLISSDGTTAEDLLEKEKPHLVIADIMMPYESGFELLDYVKNKHSQLTPFIFLSSLDQPEVIEEAFRLGADDFIKKPVNIDELLLRIKKFV